MSIKPITKPGLLSIAAAGIMVALTACGSSATTAPSPSLSTSSSPGATSTSSTPQAAEPILITIKDFTYSLPASVAPGAKITVKNEDSEKHTVTSIPKGAFEVTVDGGGGTASFTAPTGPGSYQIVCDFHADMKATLVVT